MPRPMPSPHRLLAALLALGSTGLMPLPLAAQGATDGPPQHLPLTARWCLTPQACIALEVAATLRQQTLGLQLRPPLPPLRGMWFPYAPAAVARFWMHRTPAPLDMLFVREGRVWAIERHAQPCMQLPCPSYGPDQPVDGVLELAAGQAEALGIEVGTAVVIEPWTPDLSGADRRAPAPD
jgi:uncharacterized protein